MRSEMPIVVIAQFLLPQQNPKLGQVLVRSLATLGSVVFTPVLS